ncbi:hypothetical protein BKA65DRAFT_517389 [Rhexocercosporidium sp. MPI-PUGE-AT-0058]|nr:hypothetical protein BKA65DRAFT_517389 [Rhexocercosporidium sp. MPI-PUGE-AT-0058]
MASQGNLYVQPKYIHRGGWTNYNGNAISGGQITMAKDTAELLNIFIGIFLVFAEAGLWVMITFWCFRFNNRRRRGTTAAASSRGGRFHQWRQAVLRNGGSPLSIAMAYGQISKAEGWRSPKVMWRTWPMIAAAMLSFFLFLVGLPLITALALLDKQGDEVLVRSPNCGFWKADFISTDADTTALTILTNQSWEAVSYVDNCYENDAPSTLCDRFLPQRRLPTFKWSATPCPFDINICLHTNKFPAFKMETEVLDSHKDFGINAPPHDRIQLQRTTICSPLNVTGFTNITNGVVQGEKITGVYLGPTTAGVEYTFGVSNYEKIATPGYHLSVVSSYPANGTAYSSTFTPIEGLLRNDADVSVVFLNNNEVPIKGIDGPCSDPFFSATNQSLSNHKDFYSPDSPITAIGCTDQYSFGNPVTRQWTDPMSVLDGSNWGNYTKDWDLSSRQVAALATLTWALSESGGIDRVILGLETEALLAKKYPGVFSGFQNPIPNDQWKKEVDYWFKSGLAKLQLHLINIATGPPDITLPGLQNFLPIMSADRDDLVKIMCTSQKIHNVEFKNYHRAGFVALIAIGGFLILFPVLVRCIYTCHWSQSENVSSWTSYDYLQLPMVIELDGVRNDVDGPAHPQLINVNERGTRPRSMTSGEQSPPL